MDASGVGWGGGWKRAGDCATIFSSLSHKDLQFLKLFLSRKHWVHCFNTKARILNCFLIRSNLYKGWMQLIKKKQSSEQIVGWFQTLTTRASFCDLKVFSISLILLEKKRQKCCFQMWITGWRRIDFDGTSFYVIASHFPLGAGDFQVCVLSGWESHGLPPSAVNHPMKKPFRLAL